MDQKVSDAIYAAVKKEPFAKVMKMNLVELELGYSAVEMIYDPANMDNIYARAHGGAVFALIDEAFETAGQTDGTIAVALNVNVTYTASPEPGVLPRQSIERSPSIPTSILPLLFSGTGSSPSPATVMR